MEDALTSDEGGSSGEVGTEVEKGKRRKVLRRERFSRRNEAFGASENLLDVDRRRCFRSAEIDEELSSLSAEGSHFTSATVLTPCG